MRAVLRTATGRLKVLTKGDEGAAPVGLQALTKGKAETGSARVGGRFGAMRRAATVGLRALAMSGEGASNTDVRGRFEGVPGALPG